VRSISQPGLLYAKAILLLVLGLLSAALLILQSPSAFTIALIAISIWSFARVYYFAFYVVERYIDRSFRFSGLMSLAIYLFNRRRSG
jgi:hypothetical protein